MDLLTVEQFNRLCPYVDNVKTLIEQGLSLGM